MATARTSPMPVKEKMVVPTTGPQSSCRCWPMYWPRSTVVPTASSVKTMVSDCMSWLPTDTADTLAASENCPTIIRSTAPYRDWISMANMMGNTNRTSAGTIFPWVKSLFIYLSVKRPDKTPKASYPA